MLFIFWYLFSPYSSRIWPKEHQWSLLHVFLGFSHFPFIRPAPSFCPLIPLTLHIHYPFSFEPCFTLTLFSFPCSSSANTPKTSPGEDPSRTLIALQEQNFPWFYSVVTQVLRYIFKALLFRFPSNSHRCLQPKWYSSSVFTLFEESSFQSDHNLSRLNPPDRHTGKVFFPRGLIAWRPIYKTAFSHSGYTLRRQEWFHLTSNVHLRFAQISSLVAFLGWLRGWTWILRHPFRRKISVGNHVSSSVKEECDTSTFSKDISDSRTQSAEHWSFYTGPSRV